MHLIAILELGTLAYLSQVHLFEQLTEARIGSEAIEGRIDFDFAQPLRALFVCFLEPHEGFVVLSQSSMDERNDDRLDVALCPEIL